MTACPSAEKSPVSDSDAPIEITPPDDDPAEPDGPAEPDELLVHAARALTDSTTRALTATVFRGTLAFLESLGGMLYLHACDAMGFF